MACEELSLDVLAPCAAERLPSGRGATTVGNSGGAPCFAIYPDANPIPRPSRHANSDIGWRKVKGVVYAETATVGHEVAGALVKCSQFSYFPREESCAPYRVTTGSDGVFEFDVFVHDTDSITLVAQKPGYGPAERRIRGIDCFGNCPPVDLALLESVTP